MVRYRIRTPIFLFLEYSRSVYPLRIRILRLMSCLDSRKIRSCLPLVSLRHNDTSLYEPPNWTSHSRTSFSQSPFGTSRNFETDLGFLSRRIFYPSRFRPTGTGNKGSID